MLRLRLLIATAALALSLAPTLIGPAGAATTMVMANSSTLKFEPASVTIPVGDSVMWMGVAGHTVTSDSPNWSVNASADTTYTFDAPGRYAYYCAVHGASVMSGEVIVTGPLVALLTGANENPPTSSTGTASVTLTFDAAAGTVTGTWNATGLNTAGPPPSVITAAHIHRGGAGVNGPIVIPFGGIPPTGGSFSTSTSGVDPALIREIQANPAGFYANIHTTANGGGE